MSVSRVSSTTMQPKRLSNDSSTPPSFIAGPVDTAKLVGTFLVFISVLLFTLIPALIVRHIQLSRQRRKKNQDGTEDVHLTNTKARKARLRRLIYMRVISCFNCFAAGVFVSTGLMDVLPDAIEDIEKGLKATGLEIDFPLAPFFMLIGFFVMLTIEQAVMCCSDSHGHEHHSHTSPRVRRKSPTGSSQAVNGTNLCELSPPGLRSDGDDDDQCDEETERCLKPGDRNLSASLEGVRFPSHAWEQGRGEGDELEVKVHGTSVEEGKMKDDDLGHNHVTEAMMKAGSPVRTIFLVGAMSVHALFEGLALGLRRSSTQIYQLLAAVSMHKSLIALGIGLSLGQTRSVRSWLVVVCSLIFAGMSPLGTLIGMGLTYAARSSGSSDEIGKNFQLISGSLQGMACGTFLYVTFFEVLPREINEATRPRQRAMYLTSLIGGFVAMCLFIWWAR